MPTRHLSLHFVLAAFLVGCSTSSPVGPEVGRPLTAPQSFVVHGQLTLRPDGGGGLQPLGPLPTQQDFVLRIDPTGRVSLVGTPGHAARAALASDDGEAFRTTAPL